MENRCAHWLSDRNTPLRGEVRHQGLPNSTREHRERGSWRASLVETWQPVNVKTLREKVQAEAECYNWLLTFSKSKLFCTKGKTEDTKSTL